MNLDEELLESWLKELNRTDNDAIAIQKYTQEDEGKLGVSRNYSNLQKPKEKTILSLEDLVMLSSEIKQRQDFVQHCFETGFHLAQPCNSI